MRDRDGQNGLTYMLDNNPDLSFREAIEKAKIGAMQGPDVQQLECARMSAWPIGTLRRKIKTILRDAAKCPMDSVTTFYCAGPKQSLSTMIELSLRPLRLCSG